MKRFSIILGLGSSGGRIADLCARKTKNRLNAPICFAADTDRLALEALQDAVLLPLYGAENLGEMMDRLADSGIRDWFPCDPEQHGVEYVRNLSCHRGANLWRAKAFLQWQDFLSQAEAFSLLESNLDSYLSGEASEETEVELLVVASLAGGTGSALFLPFASYLKHYLLSRYQKTLRAKAVLLSPEIYADLLTAEAQVKIRANAYAAMRELNAVYQVGTASEERFAELQKTVSFVLGGEECPSGILFDSSDRRFASPDALPFEDVSLLEKIPGCTSVHAHEEKAVSLLLAMNSHLAVKREDSDPAAVFSVASVAGISFPKEGIADFIALSDFYSAMTGEWFVLYDRIRDHLRARAENGIGLHTDPTVAFRNALLSESDRLAEEHTPCNALLGKNEGDDGFESFAYDYMESLQTELSSVNREAFVRNYFEFCEGLLARFDFGKWFSDDKKKLCEAADLAFRAAEDLYREGVRRFTESSTAFLHRIQSESDPLSLKERLLCREGSAIHPVYALMELCSLSRYLEQYIKDLSLEDFLDPTEPFTLPRSCMKGLGPNPAATSAYASAGEDRFLLLFQHNADVISAKKTDLSALEADVHRIGENVVCHWIGAHFSRLLCEIHRLIQKYVLILDSLQLCRWEAERELRLSEKRFSSEGIGFFYLNSTEEDKRAAYAAYREEERQNPDFLSLEKIRHEAMLSLLLSHREDAEAVVKEIISKARETVLSSEFFREKYGTDLLDCLKEAPSAAKAEATIRRAFGLTRPVLSLNYGEPGRECPPNRFYHFVQVSLQTASRMEAEYAEPFRESMIALFDRMGAEIHGADVDEGMSPLEMRVIQVAHGFRLSDFSRYNESEGIPTSLLMMEKSVKMMKEQYTPLWNPFLSRESYLGGKLPFISPKKEEFRLRTVLRGLLLALIEGKVVPIPEKGTSHPVYHQVFGAESVPVVWQDRPVGTEDPELLLLWMQASEELSERWSAEYEARLRAEIENLPLPGFGEQSILRMEEELRKANLFCEIRRRITELTRKVGQPFLFVLLSEWQTVLHRYLESRFAEQSMEFLTLYHRYEELERNEK